MAAGQGTRAAIFKVLDSILIVVWEKVGEPRVEANGSWLSWHELQNGSNLLKLAPTQSSPPLVWDIGDHDYRLSNKRAHCAPWAFGQCTSM